MNGFNGCNDIIEEDVKIFIGSIIHCTKPFVLEVIEDGFVIVEGKKIIVVNKNISQLENVKNQLNITSCKEIRLTKTQLLIPGLIDTHIHAPQYPNVGLGYDKPLLEWLEHYTYKLERKFRDQKLSKAVFNAVVKKTLSYGTTTATYFASLFGNSSLLLADAAIQHGQRAFVGKINMTKLAPDDYIETPQETVENTIKFINEVNFRGCDRVKPIITPRFAPSLEFETMEQLAEIARENNLNIQTHISENKEEIKLVKALFRSSSYASVYYQSGLLTPKTVLAHGVHLTDEELTLLAQTGSSISHCPDSNTCLKSGLCDVKRLVSNGIKVGLGTDVSGGPSPSIIQAMRSAIQTSIHISHSKEDYDPLTYCDVFYLATLGGAEALSLQNKIGNFEEGKDFDALIIDADVEDSAADYFVDCNCLELLQKFVFLADNRNIQQVYVSGKQVV
ncbi:unnamed protein product [Brassicogethes aeneus]|uniref:Guanine deaminase n=1 Tax=Brassicogethes aeneus TaxID=1431903 RepID=A0A9P0AVY9_BRAAE|nr:unnamed protein product [Brassicogethes aeneus]